jgi:putative ABC transport system permease protein
MSRYTVWRETLRESTVLAHDSVATQPGRSLLAVAGVVIGVVTVVLVTAVLAGLRAQVALLFREFGTDNVFAYHRSGDPYQAASSEEAQRKPLSPALARELATHAEHVRDVGVQLIVPSVIGGRVLLARGGGNQSDRALLEGVTANFFDVTAAEFAAGRPFTELEERAGLRVAVVGANVARALYGTGRSVGQTLVLAGQGYVVVGEAAQRKGSFLGENRQDNVVMVPLATVQRLYPEAEATVLYIRARPGQRDLARREAEVALRRLRGLAPEQPNDFNLSTADQIIAQFDQISAMIGLVTLGLAAVSLVIGGIGIANVMIISVTERTREIGLRLAIGARRRDVLRQFLLEAAILSLTGGVAGVTLALLLGLALGWLAPGFSAVPPPTIVAAGIAVAVGTGLAAGYWPARRAAALDPVESLRYE